MPFHSILYETDLRPQVPDQVRRQTSSRTSISIKSLARSLAAGMNTSCNRFFTRLRRTWRPFTIGTRSCRTLSRTR